VTEIARPCHSSDRLARSGERLRRGDPYFAVLDADMQHDEWIVPLMLETLESDGHGVRNPATAGQAHELALKGAETDATKRARWLPFEIPSVSRSMIRSRMACES
jgi:hypothetical protein